MQGFDLRRRSGIDPWLQFVGPATVRGLLYDLGSYPGVLPGEGVVTGELYAVSDTDRLLTRVDEIEGFQRGHPRASHYIRTAVCATRPRGVLVSAWVYFYNRGVGDAGWISDGDYARYVRHRHGLGLETGLARRHRRVD